MARLQEERKIMEAYADTAKTYTQLSLGALLLSITFIEKILGITGRVSVHYLLLFSWIFWLLAALAGAFYQYLAVRFLENLGERFGLVRRSDRPRPFADLAAHPYKVYGSLLFFFYTGTIFFAIYGAIKII